MSGAHKSIILETGSLVVPPGWEARTEVTLFEPAQKLGVPLAGKAEATKPRANVSVIRGRTKEADPARALAAFLAYTGKDLPGFRKLEEGAFRFDDGAEGVFATVAFPGPAGLMVAQHHVYRVDRDVVSHLTVTLEEREKARLEGDLGALIRSFKPQD
ncbi:MAG: hypothetical protein IT384_15365 [Deltaproteobacteria bacterium]|nr:hypothetical protein [Deltaproteobacteria bacterium]